MTPKAVYCPSISSLESARICENFAEIPGKQLEDELEATQEINIAQKSGTFVSRQRLFSFFPGNWIRE